MNQIKIAGIIFLLQAITLNGRAQALKIGDKCPDVTLTMANYKTATARLSDFKAKLLIIDFWQTFCTPCVTSFPKFDSIEKKLKGAVQILPVTSEAKEDVEFLTDKLFAVKKVRPFSVIKDTVLHSFFPHTAVPHYIWLDSSGVIKRISSEQALTEESITGFLNGEESATTNKVDITEYKDARFIVTNPFIDDSTRLEKISNNVLLYQSIFTKRIPGVWASIYADTNSITMANVSIAWFYRIPLAKYGANTAHRMIIEVKDTGLYRSITPDIGDSIVYGAAYENWAINNTYCYSLKVPIEMASKKFDIMLDDINRQMRIMKSIEGVVEKRKMKCYVLTRTSNKDKLSTKSAVTEESENRYYMHFRNYPMKMMVQKLSEYYLQLSQYPLVDETGYSGNIDIDINADLSDINDLNKAFEPYDITIKEDYKDIETMVVRQIK